MQLNRNNNKRQEMKVTEAESFYCLEAEWLREDKCIECINIKDWIFFTVTLLVHTKDKGTKERTGLKDSQSSREMNQLYSRIRFARKEAMDGFSPRDFSLSLFSSWFSSHRLKRLSLFSRGRLLFRLTTCFPWCFPWQLPACFARRRVTSVSLPDLK